MAYVPARGSRASAQAAEDAAAEAVSRSLPSAQRPDWSREACRTWEWEPGRQLLSALRDYQACVNRPGIAAKLREKVAILRHRFWSVMSGADIPLNSKIEGGLLMPHANGVVVHPEAHIGPNCLLFQQATIGTGPRPGFPRLGGHVDVGPGAKVLGGVCIGDHVTIGANAVVITDVPSGCVAVGVPASIRRKSSNSH